MPIPGSGSSIDLNQIATEFGGTTPHAINEYYRGGAYVPNNPTNQGIPAANQIAMNQFYSSKKRTAIALTITADQAGYDVYANRGPTYDPGLSDITLTINPGVRVTAPGTGAYALLVPSAFNAADTVTIINNGYVVGAGGGGGNGASVTVGTANTFTAATAGGGGGPALYAARPVTFTNNAAVAGGGGGGGGGGAYGVSTNPTGPGKSPNVPTRRAYGGGGGGGGAGRGGGAAGSGGSGAGSPAPTNLTGTAGGASTSPAWNSYSAGGGGPATAPAGAGASGGGLGAAGGTGTASTSAAGTGGAAGNYVVGGSFVTWPATGTRLGGAG